MKVKTWWPLVVCSSCITKMFVCWIIYCQLNWGDCISWSVLYCTCPVLVPSYWIRMTFCASLGGYPRSCRAWVSPSSQISWVFRCLNCWDFQKHLGDCKSLTGLDPKWDLNKIPKLSFWSSCCGPIIPAGYLKLAEDHILPFESVCRHLQFWNSASGKSTKAEALVGQVPYTSAWQKSES